MTPEPAEALSRAFQEHRAALWNLCYRMTGTAADADDLVQETFSRTLAHPPPRAEGSLRPWLLRVAVNLAKDALRQRQRRGYTGPWLPSPLDTPEPASPERPPDARYDLAESATFAFLLALERLTPVQRAVLVLRDVFDYSAEETAQALTTTPGAIRVTHHRARKAMEGYDRRRVQPTAALQERTLQALQRLMTAVMEEDAQAVEALLAADVRLASDGGGEYFAALNLVDGAQKVQRFLVSLRKKAPPDTWPSLRTLNGLPAVDVLQTPLHPKLAPRFVMQCELDETGLIRALYIQLAPSKLKALPPPAA